VSEIETAKNKDLFSVTIYTIMITGFLLLCIHQKLIADLTAGKLQSSAIRFGLVFISSFVISWFISKPLPLRLSPSWRGFAITIFFLGVLFYPLFSQFSYLGKSFKETRHEISKDHVSKMDKVRALLKNFPKEYEKHLDKYFQFPKFFIHLDALVKVYGLGVSPNNNVAVGKNGFYFEGWGARKVEKGIVEKFDNIADYMGQIPFSPVELRQWKRVLEERKYWLREQGIEYVFVLAPTKALVYPEYLPSNLQKAGTNDRVTRYQQLTRYLRTNAAIHFIDLLPPLLEAKTKRDYPLLFYKTDFHWNFYGAFIAYQAIADGLNIMFPEYSLQRPELSDFDLIIDKNWAHHRFMNMVGLPESLHRNEHYITMSPKSGGRYDTAGDIPPKGIYDEYPAKRAVKNKQGESIDLNLILNPEAPIHSILLLGDSFFEKCFYFFSAEAKRVINFRTIVNFPDTIFNYEKPDIVIQEVLNMFILRPPPENPSGFEDSYLKGKFSDSHDFVMIKKDSGEFSDKSEMKQKKYETLLPELPVMEEEVRIMRLDMAGHGEKGQADISFYGVDGKELISFNRRIEPGENVFYFELPHKTISKVIISGKPDPAFSFFPQNMEVRSDQKHF
jgi:hypothetical protein